SGEVRGCAPSASLTVTFFRRKPGHLLLPGRLRCGETLVAPIGIPAAVLDLVRPNVAANHPEWWLSAYPWPDPESHKYARGHALVAGGAVMTGAARLATRAAARLGAGLVTVVAPEPAFSIYAAALTGVIVHPVADLDGFRALLADNRRNAALIGPGAGRTGCNQRECAAAAGDGGQRRCARGDRARASRPGHGAIRGGHRSGVDPRRRRRPLRPRPRCRGPVRDGCAGAPRFRWGSAEHIGRWTFLGLTRGSPSHLVRR